jgi:hypothetical protein
VKKCNTCGVEKPESEFYKDSHNKGGTRHRCRACEKVLRSSEEARQRQREATARWRKAHPEDNKISSKNTKLKQAYGITLADYQAMWEKQNGKCAICGEKTALHVDHDHETGAVRDLLCCHCNKGLSGFKDSPLLTAKGGQYLLRHRNFPG